MAVMGKLKSKDVLLNEKEKSVFDKIMNFNALMQ